MYNTFDEKLDATLGSKTLEGNLLKYEILNESFDNLEYSDDIDEPLITTELKIDVDDFYKVAERAASIDWPHRITVTILSQESTPTSIQEDQIEVDVAGNIYIDKFLQYGIKSLKITNNRALFNNLKMGSDITEFPQKGSSIYIDGIDNVVNAMSDIKKKLDAAANGALDIFSFTEPQVIDQIMETSIPNNYINSVFKEAWLHYNLPGKYHKTSSIKLDTN